MFLSAKGLAKKEEIYYEGVHQTLKEGGQFIYQRILFKFCDLYAQTFFKTKYEGEITKN